MKKLIAIALALALLGVLAGPAGAQSCPSNQYVVRPGDTLFSIGQSISPFGLTAQALAAANGITNPNLIYAGQVLCIPQGGPPVSVLVPVFTITKVVRDTSVTISTSNFPAGQTFTARMGPMGTRGIGGTTVGTTNSGGGGFFTATYNIPANLRGSNQIAIRLESPSGHFSYNWFFNNTTP
jgi:LysM repeat protein